MNKVQWERAIQKARPYEPNREQFVNLRRRAMGFLVGYSLSAMTVFGLIGFCIVREIVDWAKGFKQPAINANAIQLLFEDRPAIIWLLAASVVVGLVVALAGTAVLFAIMGDERRPNRKVLLLAAGLPLMLWLMGLAMTVTTSPYGALLAAPIMLGFSSMMAPAILGLLALATSNISLKLCTEQEWIDQEDLPHDIASWFQECDANLQALQFQPLGNLAYRPSKNRFRRAYVHASRTVYASATCMGPTRCLSLLSVTNDGAYFETTDLNQPILADRAPERLRLLADAPPDTLFHEHLANVAAWCQTHQTRVRAVETEDELLLDIYGRIYVAQNIPHPLQGFQWLADPYNALPIPPIPGKPFDSLDTLAPESPVLAVSR